MASGFPKVLTQPFPAGFRDGFRIAVPTGQAARMWFTGSILSSNANSRNSNAGTGRHMPFFRPIAPYIRRVCIYYTIFPNKKDELFGAKLWGNRRLFKSQPQRFIHYSFSCRPTFYTNPYIRLDDAIFPMRFHKEKGERVSSPFLNNIIYPCRSTFYIFFRCRRGRDHCGWAPAA